MRMLVFRCAALWATPTCSLLFLCHRFSQKHRAASSTLCVVRCHAHLQHTTCQNSPVIHGALPTTAHRLNVSNRYAPRSREAGDFRTECGIAEWTMCTYNKDITQSCSRQALPFRKKTPPKKRSTEAILRIWILYQTSRAEVCVWNCKMCFVFLKKMFLFISRVGGGFT